LRRRTLTQPFLDTLSKLRIRVIGTNQFIYPLNNRDRRYCNIVEADEKHVKMALTLAHSGNILDLVITKEDFGFTIKVERFIPTPLRNYTVSLYFQDQLVLEGIGGEQRNHVGLQLALQPEHRRQPPPKILVPHIENKRVVAVITTFNALKWTQKCVESIRKLQTTHKVSIVISDNCSTDGSREWFEKEKIPYVTLFGRQSVAAGLNLGISEALKLEPDYLLVMNNDVILPPNYLDVLVDHYEDKRRESCLFITGYIRNMNYSHPDLVRIRTLGTTEDMKDFMDTGDFSCFLITPETIERAGLFDSKYDPRYGEDNDFLHAIYVAGGRAFRTGQANFYHDWGTTMVVHPEEKERWIPTFRKNLLYYKEKWGDFPRGAERHAASRDLTDGFPCEGGGAQAKKIKTWKRDQVALIQMGRIGDIIATLPIAKELHNAGEEVVWLVNQRFQPLLKTVDYIDEIVPFPDGRDDSETYFGKRFEEARSYAEKEEFRRILIAQITPLYTREFYESAYGHNKFHYILCLGRMPKSLKPDLPIVPFGFDKAHEFTVGLIPHSNSLPIHWRRHNALDPVLQSIQEAIDVQFLNLSLQPYEGKARVNEVGKNIAIHQLSGAISNLNLLLTVDTGGYYPGLVTKTPIIHILPKPRFADDPKAPPKYSCDDQGFSSFAEIIDYWFSGSLVDLDKIIIKRLTEKTDLRNIRKGYAELKSPWTTIS